MKRRCKQIWSRIKLVKRENWKEQFVSEVKFLNFLFWKKIKTSGRRTSSASWPPPQRILSSPEERDFFVPNSSLVHTPSLHQLSIPFPTSTILLSLLALFSWHIKISSSLYFLKQNKTLPCHFAPCDSCLVLSSFCNHSSRKSNLPGFTSSLLFLPPPCNLAILPILNCECPHLRLPVNFTLKSLGGFQPESKLYATLCVWHCIDRGGSALRV